MPLPAVSGNEQTTSVLVVPTVWAISKVRMPAGPPPVQAIGRSAERTTANEEASTRSGSVNVTASGTVTFAEKAGTVAPAAAIVSVSPGVTVPAFERATYATAVGATEGEYAGAPGRALDKIGGRVDEQGVVAHRDLADMRPLDAVVAQFLGERRRVRVCPGRDDGHDVGDPLVVAAPRRLRGKRVDIRNGRARRTEERRPRRFRRRMRTHDLRPHLLAQDAPLFAGNHRAAGLSPVPLHQAGVKGRPCPTPSSEAAYPRPTGGGGADNVALSSLTDRGLR